MAEVLVLVEHADGAPKKVTAELITAARALGEPSAVVVGKPGTADALVDGLKAAGAAKIYVAESDDADNYLITPFVDVLASLVESASPAGVVLAAIGATARRSAAGWPRASAPACSPTSSRSKKAARPCTPSSVARTPSTPRPPARSR